ncbi:hypothetical protein [Microseira sp. BLCC-F43]|jgi:hypothetical protein
MVEQWLKLQKTVTHLKIGWAKPEFPSGKAGADSQRLKQEADPLEISSSS